jgi:hypothetical protein
MVAFPLRPGWAGPTAFPISVPLQRLLRDLADTHTIHIPLRHSADADAAALPPGLPTGPPSCLPLRPPCSLARWKLHALSSTDAAAAAAAVRFRLLLVRCSLWMTLSTHCQPRKLCVCKVQLQHCNCILLGFALGILPWPPAKVTTASASLSSPGTQCRFLPRYFRY